MVELRFVGPISGDGRLYSRLVCLRQCASRLHSCSYMCSAESMIRQRVNKHDFCRANGSAARRGMKSTFASTDESNTRSHIACLFHIHGLNPLEKTFSGTWHVVDRRPSGCTPASRRFRPRRKYSAVHRASMNESTLTICSISERELL